MSENQSDETIGAHSLQDKAVKWIVDRHLAETWSDGDQSRLDAWLNESPAHLVAYWRAKDSWNRTELLGALRSFRPRQDRNPSTTWARLIRPSAVAAVIVLAGATTALLFLKPPEQRYQTALSGHETLSLADGSKIELNTNTSLRVGEEGAQRTVTMERGEAFFQIKHDSQRPFVVNVAGRRIVDIGTKFSVLADGQNVRIALVDGLARVENISKKVGAGSSTLLTPGDVAIGTEHSFFISKKSKSQLDNQLAWRRGVLVFDNTPLIEVAAEFNRYNLKKIVIADQMVGHQTINGAFQVNDLEAMTNVAREVFRLRVERRKDEIFISH